MRNTVSFWDGNHPRQEEYDTLWNELVPASGYAETLNGELIRAAGRLFYEYCNNGNCNAVDLHTESCSQCWGSGEEEVDCRTCGGDGYTGDDDDDSTCSDCEGSGTVYDTCSECDGGGEVYGEPFITNYYQEMLDLLYHHDMDGEADDLENFMLNGPGYSNYTFSQEEMDHYNNMVVAVLDYVKTHKNVEYKSEKDAA